MTKTLICNACFIFAALTLASCASENKVVESTQQTEAPAQEDPAHYTHKDHSHEHGNGCGHKAITHDNHVDYLHDDHYHFSHKGHTDEHGYKISSRSAASTQSLEIKHDQHPHQHGKNCGHKKVAHEDHFDFIHDGHYHHVHADHVDEHGIVINN